MGIRSDPRPHEKGHDDIDSALLKAIVDAAVDAILVIDEVGCIRMANPATERLFGYSSGDLLGENVSLLMPEPHRSAHDAYLRHHLRTGERKIIGIGREVSGLRRDGSTFPMYLSVGEVRHLDHRYFAGIIHDLSERRQTETTLRALAGATALGNADSFVAVCARELARTYGARFAFVGVFADAAQRSIRTLAVWAGDGYAENFTYTLPGTPCEDILTCRMEIVPSEAAKRYPHDKLLEDMGVESYFGAPLVDSSGRNLGLVSVMDTKPMHPNIWTRPILGVFANRIALELERREAEERLRQSEAYMRLTLENAPIGIASADLQGRLLDANPAFAGLLGYTREELVGKRVADITEPQDREETQRHFEALVRGDIPLSLIHI